MRSHVLNIVVVATLEFFGPMAALGASSVPTTMSIDVVPTSISPGQEAVVTATVTPNSGNINCGKGQIQYQIYDIDGSSIRIQWTQLANNLPVSNNKFSATFDTNSITVFTGEKVSFRAEYSSTGPNCDFDGQDFGHSPTTDLLIVGSSAGSCPDEQVDGVYITIEGPDGNGTPVPGETVVASFDVVVTACEDVFDVTAQGGANGWAPIKSYMQAPGNPPGGSVEEKVLKKNTVYLWTIGNLLEGQSALLTVQVEGTIKDRLGECGKVKLLNGDWSALYAIVEGGIKTKSDYTSYTATVEVTCP